MKLPILLAAIIYLSAMASAQEADVPPSELPVDPYVIRNENAGAAPLANETIYEPFAAAAGVSPIVDDMMDHSMAYPRISEVFVVSDLVDLRRILKEVFCFSLAGPCDYRATIGAKTWPHLTETTGSPIGDSMRWLRTCNCQ